MPCSLQLDSSNTKFYSLSLELLENRKFCHALCYLLPEIHVLKAYPQCDCVCRYNFIKVIKVKWSRKGRVLIQQNWRPSDKTSPRPHAEKRLWEHSEKGDVCRSGSGASPDPGSSGSLILNFQHPELRENKLLFQPHSPSGLRHSWALPSDGSILKLFTPIYLGFIFLSTVPPPTPHPKQTQNRASSFALSFPGTLTSLAVLLFS